MKEVASEVLSSDTADTWLDDEGVLWYEIYQDAQETLRDVEANLANAVQITGGTAAPVLYDMRQMKGIDGDALQAYYHRPEALQTTKAMAMVQPSWFANTVANLVGFRFYARAEYPARSFRDLDEAYVWLRGFK
jgi:hypothetical protein